MQAFATALTEDFMLVHITRAEAEIACGRAEATIGELEALAAKHPYREPLWAQLKSPPITLLNAGPTACGPIGG